MWCRSDDNTEPIIKAAEQIRSAHRACALTLPETAIVFFMSKGVEYLCAHCGAKELPELFPRFLNRCPIWEIPEARLCFLDGGRGAPQACDTVETLAALGVKKLLAVGMCGAFAPGLRPGELIVPDKAFVEEGTSLHYYPSIDYALPDSGLLAQAAARLEAKTLPIVSTDAVYRQTFAKEQLWREKGAVAVDMETSAVFSVSRALGLRALALLMVSDVHPLRPGDPKWDWKMTKEMRDALAEKSIAVARLLSDGSGGTPPSGGRAVFTKLGEPVLRRDAAAHTETIGKRYRYAEDLDLPDLLRALEASEYGPGVLDLSVDGDNTYGAGRHSFAAFYSLCGELVAIDHVSVELEALHVRIVIYPEKREVFLIFRDVRERPNWELTDLIRIP